MFLDLYNLSIEIIGVVPNGLEVIYIFSTILLFFVVLLPFIFSFKIVYDIFN